MTEKKIRMIAIGEKFIYKDFGFTFEVEITEVLPNHNVKVRILKILSYTKASKLMSLGMEELVKNKIEFEILKSKLK